jgi:2'-5' RNA ligase
LRPSGGGFFDLGEIYILTISFLFMKYGIVYLVRGDAAEYHQNLVKSAGLKFGEMKVLDRNVPVHVTLKFNFFIDDIGQVEEVVKKVTMESKPEKIRFGDFKEFNGIAAVSKNELSEGSLDIQKRLIDGLKAIGVEIHSRDLDYKPHSTLILGSTKEKFKLIWKYLNSLEKPIFDLKFDNITILRKPKDAWEIHKVFEIK